MRDLEEVKARRAKRLQATPGRYEPPPTWTGKAPEPRRSREGKKISLLGKDGQHHYRSRDGAYNGPKSSAVRVIHEATGEVLGYERPYRLPELLIARREADAGESARKIAKGRRAAEHRARRPEHRAKAKTKKRRAAQKVEREAKAAQRRQRAAVKAGWAR